MRNWRKDGAITLSFTGDFGKAPDLRHDGVPGCPGRLHRHVYRLHQLVREGRQRFDVLSCVLYSCSMDSFRKSKLFDVPIRADKRLPGHFRDLASESLDGFDRRGHCLDRDIVGRALNASGAGGFLFSHYLPLNH
jgi:hypothetical protein